MRIFGLVLSTYLMFSTPRLQSSEYWDFISQAYQNFQQVGAVAPFSRYTAFAMIDFMHEALQKKSASSGCEKLRILEVGAGTGAISVQLVYWLEKMGFEYQLDLVELSEQFCTILQRRFNGNHKVAIYSKDILDFQVSEKYDFIISTLPLNCEAFSPKVVETILTKYSSWVSQQGLIIFVEYIFFGYITQKFFLDTQEAELYALKRKIVRDFRESNITQEKSVLLNIPPTQVYAVQKGNKTKKARCEIL